MLTAFALVATLLAVHTAPALVGTRDAETSCTCPLHSRTALLFEDCSRRVPDFWWEDSLAVQEIVVCSRGISFVFVGHDEGSLFLSVLVFPDPLGDAWDSERHRPPIPEGRSSDADRYRDLLAALSQAAGYALDTGARFDFGAPSCGPRPCIIDPRREFFLRWRGRSVPLRGYLDVYLSAIL